MNKNLFYNCLFLVLCYVSFLNGCSLKLILKWLSETAHFADFGQIRVEGHIADFGKVKYSISQYISILKQLRS